MIKRIKGDFITLSLTILMVLIVFNAGLIFYNRYVMIENNLLQAQTEVVRRHWNSIFDSNLRRMDLGLRGYALTRNPQLLDPYRTGARDMPITLKNIDSLLTVQNLDTMRDAFTSFSAKVNDYL